MEAIIGMSKQEQYILFELLKPFIISNNETARLCDVSPSLVGNVRQGVNNNEKVITVIFQNLKEGWESSIPVNYKKLVKEIQNG